MSRILIVDDENRIRKTFSKLLASMGHEILSAPNAGEAKDLLVKEKIDLMLLDIKMGEVNGDVLFEVARAFHPHIKIIVSSVYPLEEQQEKIHGANDYYDKSESLSVLSEKVSRLTRD